MFPELKTNLVFSTSEKRVFSAGPKEHVLKVGQILLDTKAPVTSWQTVLPYDNSALKVKEIRKQEEIFPTSASDPSGFAEHVMAAEIERTLKECYTI